MKEQKKGKSKIPNSKGKMQSSGVTLIALIITIIILLILAMTSVALIMRWNIIKHTETASEEYQGASERDILEVAYSEYALDKTAGKGDANLTVEEAQSVDGNGTTGWTVKFPSGNVYTVDDEGDIWEAVQVTVEGEGGEEGEPVILTEENVDEYLGKEVTDFKTNVGDTEEVPKGEGGTEQEDGTDNKDGYKVSTKYRLYYVDFEGKYGDKGAVYLKADCNGTEYALPTTDATESTDPNIKIRDLNPGLYNAGVAAPDADNNNMKAVTWLLDTKNWENLKSTVNKKYQDSVKYIVGAPPVEMMMDSYNTHYGLIGDSPKANAIASEDRPKLFYQYPYNGDSNNSHYGYGVGPCDDESATEGYYIWTSNNTVQTDSAINSMYHPGSSIHYWLASPSADDSTSVVTITHSDDGCIGRTPYYSGNEFCPLVCLDSSAHLNLEQGTQVAD